jgi:hypothetical protein
MINEYETQSTLNPKLWDGDKLQPKLRIGFLKIANAFYDFLEVQCDIKDIIIIGSSANYNWTKHSDIDLHVVINYLDVNDNMHIVNNYMHAKKSIWNNTHPLTYKGMNIELYAQDANDNLHSSVGVYSVMRGKWIRKPSSDTVSIDDAAIQQKADPYEYEIDSLRETDPHIEQKIKNIKQRLRHLRQSGLDAEGEYSVENMAYKHLRNKGFIERLKQLEQQVALSSLKIETVINETNMADTYTKAKDKVKNFISAMRTEKDETKQALVMVLRHINGEKLTAEEWRWVRGQMKDVVKLLGLTTVAIMPGGSLVALLAKATKMDKHLLPSAFHTPQDEKDITESLIMHVTRKQPLDAPGWANIIKKSGGVVDARGQWEHPGVCTMIPTTDGAITMRDVPHPVLGIDETGHMLMMRPEHDYQFPGRNVFEIPHTGQYQTMVMRLRNQLNNGSIDAK